MAPALNNRRKVERICLGDDLYAIVDTSPPIMGQVVEISATGLAFTFVDLGMVSDRLVNRTILNVDLFEGGRGYFIQGMACRIVSEIEHINTSPLAFFAIKRVGVAFQKLTLPQQVRVNQMVRQRRH